VTESFEEAKNRRVSGRLPDANLRQRVLEAGGVLTIDQTTMPGG